MTAADQGRLIKATASGITVTTPDAGTVGAPFLFAVNNQSTGTITLAGNATNSQTVDGQTTQVIQSGGSCLVKTDGTNWFTVGLKAGTNALAGNNYGFDSAINLQLVASSISGNTLLQVAVKTKAGNDPSASDPVLVPFRDVTSSNGDPVWITITSALSINTNATGATLGTQNNVPFRFWVVVFNNASTPVLALWHSGAGTTSPNIFPLNEGVLAGATGISSGATSANTFYAPNGTSFSSKTYRILGYIEYSSGLSTAGTYSSAPTFVQLFGPGIKKPGDEVQSLFTQNGTFASASVSYTPSSTLPTTAQAILGASQPITPTSSANILEVEGQVAGVMSNTSSAVTEFIWNGSAVIAANVAPNNSILAGATLRVLWRGIASNTNSQTYSIYATASGTSADINSTPSIGQVFTTSTCNTFIRCKELMG